MCISGWKQSQAFPYNHCSFYNEGRQIFEELNGDEHCDQDLME